MYLLIRTVSAYIGPDLLLGAFWNEAEAARARETYLDTIRQDDPWAEQPYRESSPEDVMIESVSEVGIAGEPRRVFVVSEYTEGFGQVLRKFVAVCGAKADAEKIQSDVKKDDQFPLYRMIHEIEAGTLRSTTPVSTPSP